MSVTEIAAIELLHEKSLRMCCSCCCCCCTCNVYWHNATEVKAGPKPNEPVAIAIQSLLQASQTFVDCQHNHSLVGVFVFCEVKKRGRQEKEKRHERRQQLIAVIVGAIVNRKLNLP